MFTKFDNLYVGAKCKAVKAKEALTKKLSGDSQLVVALVLVAVAVGLCIIFREQIYAVMTNLFSKTSGSIDELLSGQTITNP